MLEPLEKISLSCDWIALVSTENPMLVDKRPAVKKPTAGPAIANVMITVMMSEAALTAYLAALIFFTGMNYTARIGDLRSGYYFNMDRDDKTSASDSNDNLKQTNKQPNKN